MRINHIEDRMCLIMDSKQFNNALLLIIVGLLLIMIGTQLQMRLNDKRSVKQIIDAQTQSARLKESNEDLALKVQILTSTNAELLGYGAKVQYVNYGGEK